MKRFACMVMVAAALVHANEEIAIDSGFAEYDGKRIVLSKSVTVEHEMGKIAADEMVLIPAENDSKKLGFVFLEMKKNVEIALKEGGSMSCSAAELDYANLTGRFNGGDHDYVVYREECPGKGNVRTPLEVKARQMTVQLQEDKSKIIRIHATKDVAVTYNQDYLAEADEAIYQRLPGDEAERNPGEIVLWKSAQNGVCRVTTQNGDVVDASRIRMETVKRGLTFTDPNGALFFNNQQKRLDFSCGTLLWDDRRDLLTLRDHVQVDQAGIGRLRSDGEVQIFRCNNKGKRKVRTVESSGETILEHSDAERGFVHTLIAYGKVTVDHEHFKTTIQSPRDSKGLVPEGQQVFFSDRLGEIYADTVVLEYEEIDQVLNPSKLILDGHVRLLNRSSVNPDETEAFLQYALADRVEFDPKTSEMLLSSVKPARVLFFDKANNLQISAPGVKIKRDPRMKKESIQGLGDVNFSFVDQELEKLKKHFALDLLKKGSE